MENYFWLNLCSLQNTERAIPENIYSGKFRNMENFHSGKCLLKHSFKLDINPHEVRIFFKRKLEIRSANNFLWSRYN